jgi:tetratricopeptide (TPR) repeat protein
MYYCCTDNYSKRFEYSEKILSLLESYSHIIEENPGIYVASLKNYCTSLIGFGDLKKALKIARKLRQLHLLYDISRWENERNLAQLLSYDIEIIAFILMGKADKAIGLESEIEALFKLHKLNTNKNNLFELIYNLALAFFAKGNYEKSLSWLFKILNERDLNYREDLYIASRLLALIAHYELKNTILLNNLITSTQRFLKIRKRLHATESAYLHFLKLCNKHDDKEKQRADLIALKKEIEKYSDDSDELKMINNIFLMPWIKHKLTGKSVAAIVAEDYKNYTGKKK